MLFNYLYQLCSFSQFGIWKPENDKSSDSKDNDFCFLSWYHNESFIKKKEFFLYNNFRWLKLFAIFLVLPFYECKMDGSFSIWLDGFIDANFLFHHFCQCVSVNWSDYIWFYFGFFSHFLWISVNHFFYKTHKKSKNELVNLKTVFLEMFTTKLSLRLFFAASFQFEKYN